MTAADAYDEWLACQPTAIHDLTIAEIWMAAYDAGVQTERYRQQEWDESAPAVSARLTDA